MKYVYLVHCNMFSDVCGYFLNKLSAEAHAAKLTKTSTLRGVRYYVLSNQLGD